MQEVVYKLKIAGVSLEAVLYEEAFHMRNAATEVVQLRHLHQHATYEIFLVLDGVLTMIDEDSNREYTRSAVIVPPGYDHYAVAQVEVGCCFYFSILSEEERYKRLLSGITAVELGENAAFYAARLAQAAEDPGARETVAPLLTLLFLELMERIAPAARQELPPEKQSRYIHIIEHAVNRCVAAGGEKLTLESLAGQLYLCPKQVARIIRKAYGCTLSELVHRRRLTAACTLLRRTDMPVGEIAEAVGYAYENYFFSLFKKTYGISPLQYRNGKK